MCFWFLLENSYNNQIWYKSKLETVIFVFVQIQAASKYCSNDILTKRKGYKIFTNLNISMKYYTFELMEEANGLCMMVTPFEKYHCNMLPLGIKSASDFAQEIIEGILHENKEVDIYIDYFEVFSNDWEIYLIVLDKILNKL